MSERLADSGVGSVPVWTLRTQEADELENLFDESMTPGRLAEWRTVLAAVAAAPIATLELHPVPQELDRSQGMPLPATSTLAVQLSQLINAASAARSDGEALYRMVVPARFAGPIGSGLLRSMPSNAVRGGIHSGLLGSSGIAGQATFVRVPRTAAGAAGSLAVTAPFMMAAVAAGLSLNADSQGRRALAKITELLEKLHDRALADERSDLDSCRDPIEKASAALLDKAPIGHTAAIGHAVDKVNTAIATFQRRLKEWQGSLDGFGDRPVEIAPLRKAFDGIDKDGGRFQAELELGEFAIALKKRVIVLQAVEQAQLSPGNPLENFVHALKVDQERVLKLESEVADLKHRLGTLRLDRSHGIRDGIAVTAGDVDHLLRTIYRLRDEFGARDEAGGTSSDVVIDLARNADGSVVVLPAISN